MSSPNDINVNVKFTATTEQLTKMFGQLQRLQNKVSSMSKQLTGLRNGFKGLGSSLDTTKGKVSNLNKQFESQGAKQDRVKASVQKLKGQMKGYGDEVKRTDDKSKKANKTLGFTGLAFGFIGGLAGFAANRIKNEFIGVLEDTAAIATDLQRLTLFSDTGIQNNAFNLEALEQQTKRVMDIGLETGIAFEDLNEILTNVEKAAPRNINATELGDVVVNLKLLEKELDSSSITQDFITFASNFEEIPLKEMGDSIFAFAKENKLSFSASAKSFGFAAQSSKLLNADLNELLAVTTIMANKIPGQQGTVGRSLRQLGIAISNPKTIKNLRALGINVLDQNGRFIGLSNSMEILSGAYKEFSVENQEKAAQFLKIIGLSANARDGLLAYADASIEAKKVISESLSKEVIAGTLDIGAEVIKTSPEATIGKIKNQITSLKLAFTQELFPALSEINELFKELLADEEFTNAIKDLGRAIGQNLVLITKAALPVLKTLGAIFKENSPAIGILAGSLTVLFFALSALSIAAPLAGLFFALIFVYEKLTGKTGTAANLTKVFASRLKDLAKVAKAVARAIGTAFANLGRIMFQGLSSALRFLIPHFVAFGARAGAFFGAAFNVISNAFISSGKWLLTAIVSIGKIFLAAGAGIGLGFGAAFTVASEAIMKAGAWLGRVLLTIGELFITAGGGIGLGFGGAFAVASEAIMKAGAWLGRVFTTLGTAFAKAAGFMGTAFGGAFTFASSAVIKVGTWIVTALASLNSKIATAGGASGRIFGASFIGGFLSVITAAIAAAVVTDILTELITGESPVKDIQKRLGIKDPKSPAETLGIPIPKEPIISSIRESPFEKAVKDFFKPLTDLFNTPEVQEFPTTMGTTNSLYKDVNAIMLELNPKYTSVSGETSTQTIRIQDMIKKLETQIIETVKNINIISAMTTKVAEVNLMFTKLVAEGNRAAGKLASLRVSTSGKFSITDQGISATDRAAIAAAAQELAGTKAAQTKLAIPTFPQVQEQTNNITINPTLVVQNAQGLNERQIVDLLSRDFASVLQKNITNIIA